MNARRNIIMIGAFPPPVHGMAATNQAILEIAELQGWHVSKLSTAINTLERGLLSRLPRLMVMIRVWGRLIKAASPRTIVYASLSGGWGQVYDAITLLIARLLGMKLFLHHQSTAYLSNKNRLTQLLFAIGGRNTTHVVLCGNMRAQLYEKYGHDRSVILSNLGPMARPPKVKERKTVQSIGFLSNITTEKGGWEFIELSRAIRSKGWALNIIAAGPCYEGKLLRALTAAHQSGTLEWRGAIYEDEKQRFFHNIDVFIFPTKYINEAEPLVVWEALSTGVPVIAFGRGCIPGQIGQAGKALPEDQDFVNATLRILETWLNDPLEYQQYVYAALEQHRTARETADSQLLHLLQVLETGK